MPGAKTALRSITQLHVPYNNTLSADSDLEDVFDKIGMRQEGPDDKGVADIEEERLFEYPEIPERRMKFGDLLIECGYDEDVLHQYEYALDVEVRTVELGVLQ